MPMKEKKKSEPALCFVPEMLVDYLNKSNIRLLEPASFFIHGVCLLVDISGFTKLSGQFCDQGKAGIDDLQLATNGFMGQLVDIIYKFGGDIIKFAGDAIICVFSADFTPSADAQPLRRSSVGSFASFDEKEHRDLETSSVEYSVTINTPSSVSAEVVLRVMHCAKLLTEVQTDKLTVHVAMSCGEMCFGILGGFENRWECLISGPCIHQLSNCLDDAPSKHAVISRRCARTVKEALVNLESKPFEALTAALETGGGRYNFTMMPLPSGNYRIVSVDFSSAAEAPDASFKAKVKFEWNDEERSALVKRFVPQPIAEQLDRGSSLHYMAEIREVTTMFMKWDSYDANVKHRDLLELQPCFYQAQRILHNTGAFVRQFLVDDKGCVLIACWGMPSMSYLDNSHRAVTAAAQIRIACYQLEMNCSFGITTGDVYCGTVGSALRMEYAAIGSVVNMSARLMGKAAGGILIDEATYNHLPAHDMMSLQKLTPIKVKGRDEPLQVYSYIETGLKHSTLKLSDDLDLPQYCKYPLSALLGKMAGNSNANKRKSKPDIPRLDLEPRTCGTVLRRMFTRPPPTITAQQELLTVVLIEGKAGSGRTSVVTWLKNQATEYNIQTCCVRLTKKDTSVEYGMWKKLFLQLMPKDLFLNNHVQRNYVQEILRLAYPKTGRSQGFAALQILGITCTIEDGVSRHRPTGLSEPSVRKQFAWTGSGKAGNTAENMHTIFAYLLSLHPTLVIVEGLEVSDEASLALLLQLGTLRCRSAVVCTALCETPELPLPAKKSKHILDAKPIVVLGKSVFAQQYRARLLGLRNASLITLENYTPEEIDKMLCVTLGVRSVPPATSQLVQDFSGGSYFWVREILQFIKEHGAEHFLAALGESDSAAAPCASPAPSAVGTAGGFDISHLISPRYGGTAISSMLSSAHTSVHSNSGSGQHGSVRNSVHGGHSVHNTTTRGSSLRRSNSIMKSRPNSANGGASSQQGKLVSFTEPSGGGNAVEANNALAPSQKQLDHLLLVRFGGLLSEEQRVLRKASIIGVTFATSVLFTLLSPHLQAHLAECLKTLVQQKWIYEDLTCEHTYQFAHGHVRQLVYELTPPSERNILHQLTADHLSQTYPEDRSRYLSIWYHYQHCDTDKALQYAVKTVAVMVESDDIFEYGDCLDLLFSSYNCCKTIYDIYVLQQLVSRVQLRIERMRLTPLSPVKQSWFARLLRSSVYASNNKILPQKGVLQRDGSVWIEDPAMDEEVCANAHLVRSTTANSAMAGTTNESLGRNSNSSAKSTTSNAKTAHEIETFTKQHLLEQIDRFRYYLSAKSIELSMANNHVHVHHTSGPGGEAGGGAGFGARRDEYGGDSTKCELGSGGVDEPTEWQRKFLNIKACRDC